MKRFILILALGLVTISTVRAADLSKKVYALLSEMKFSEAEKMISQEKGRVMFQSNPKKIFEEVVQIHNLEGVIHHFKYDLDKAEKSYAEGIDYLEQKIQKFRRMLVPEDFTILENYADAALDMGNFEKAKDILMLSDSLRSTFLSKGESKGCAYFFELGKYYALTSQKELAIDAFYKYIKNASSTYLYSGIQMGKIGEAYNYLAELQLQQKFPRLAIRYTNRSVEYSGNKWVKKTSGSKSRNIILAKNNLSRSFLMMGNITKAKKWNDEALQQHFVEIGDTAFATLPLWMNRGEILWQLGMHKEAHKNFKIANELQLEYVVKVLPKLSAAEKENFYFELLENTNLFYVFIFELLEKTEDQLEKVALLKEVFNLRINTKAKVLSESNKVFDVVQQSDDPELKTAFSLWKQKRNEYSRLSNAGSKSDKEKLALLEEEVAALEKKFSTILKSDGITVEAKKVSLRNIPSGMIDGSVAIEVIRIPKYKYPGEWKNKDLRESRKAGKSRIPNRLDYTNASYAFLKIDRKSDVDYLVLENGKELEGKFFKFYRNACKFKLNDNVSYDNFWAHTANWTKNTSQVYLSGDGVYNQLNLSVLKVPEENKYLVEKYGIANISNLSEIKLKSEQSTKIESAALIGRPSYSFSSIFAEDTSASYVGERSIEEFHGAEIVDLPGTQKEVESIYATLAKGGVRTEKYLKQNATEDALKEISSTSILHIATHGFFVKGEGEKVNPMLRSGLLLAGVSDFDGTALNDGILTAYEASNLNLKNTELVILSACETGLGEVVNGEGVYGLQRAFQIAGVKYVLMSMWKVDDEATMKLMTTFYTEMIKTNDIPSSFKTAQIKLKETYPSPYYWGAFKLIGV